MAAETLSIDAWITKTERKSQARKPLKLLMFRGNYDAPVPSLDEGFFDPTDRSKIKLDTTLWTPYGILSKEGSTRDTKVKNDETDGYNYADPIREDFLSADRTLSFTLRQEYTRVALEAQYGMDLSKLKPNQTKGIAFDEPNIPLMKFYRILAISMDYFMSDIAKPILAVDLYLAAKQNELPKQVRKSNGTQDTEIGMRIYSDEQYGTPVRHWIDGTGYDATAHGFEVAAAA